MPIVAPLQSFKGAAESSAGRPSLARRALMRLAVGAAALLFTRRVLASDVPPRVQARLLAKVAEYDRNLVAREGPRVILMVRKPGEPRSASAVDELAAELKTIDQIAGASHREAVIDYTTPAALRAAVQAEGAAIAYLSPGLDAQLGNIADALRDVAVLTVGSDGADAEKGAVLGFDVVSGRVQLVVNLARAKAQHVSFRPEFLTLARVIR